MLKKQPKLVGIKPKSVRREKTRERKALHMAKLEKSIEKELIERLKSGIYGKEPLNVDQDVWKKILASHENQEKEQKELDYENEVEFLSDEENDIEEWSKEYEFEEEGEELVDDSSVLDRYEYESHESDISSENISDQEEEIEDIFQKKRKYKDKLSKKSKKGKTYIEIEYEQENHLMDRNTRDTKS